MPKSKKASVLVYSLIILSVMLMIATAFTTTSIINRKNASTTGKSSQSFQVADSGSSLMLKLIKNNPGATIGTIPGVTCNAGVVTFNSANGLRTDSTAEVTFKDASDNSLDCSDNVSDVDSIKSVGKFADTSRAIEVAVAQSADTPSGAVIAFNLDSCPTGWSLFNDARNRVIVGLGTETEFDSRGETGGEKTHNLTTNEIPSHNHGVLPYAGVEGSNYSAHINSAVNGASYGRTGSSGGGQAHNNLQPYVTLLYCVKD